MRLTREGIIQTAINELASDAKYVHQGQTLGSALDCTGFVYAVFKENGFEFEYDHTLVEAHNGSIKNAIDTVLKPTENPRTSDIVAFEKDGEVFHVAIYLSDRNLGTFIHINKISNKVTLDNFANSAFWRRYFYGYYSIHNLLGGSL
jgi:cell wall-associated NlpC family hydrolase